MNRFIPPDPSCAGCQEVIQICLSRDGYNAVKCQQIPVGHFIDGGSSPTLNEMMPTLLAIFGLMALAWVFKVILNNMLLGD